MSQLVLSRGTYQRKNLFNWFFRKFQIGPYFLLGSLILSVALITVITLMFSARQVTKGYVLNQLDAKHQDLVRENERIDMKISDVRSLQYIQSSAKVASMIRPDQIVFLNSDTAIAKN